MADIEDSSEVSPSGPDLRRQWEEFRSRLHESGHRFNFLYARQKDAGENLDPQEALRYLTKTYERTAAMAVNTVTDHESALACVKELDIFLKKMLKMSSRLLREMLPRESRAASEALCSALRRRLLLRSEHWKAEAHKLARKESKPVALRILCAAMGRRGWNEPQLAGKIRANLKRKGETKLKVDRSTVYRILRGKTKKPHPAIRHGLIEALQLEEEDAATVRRELSGTKHAPASKTESKK